MALEAGCGDKVQILTSGADAKAAGEQLAELLAQGCGDDECAPPSTRTTAPAARAAAPALPHQSSDPNILLGASASPGIAVGEIFQVRRVHFPIVEAGAGVDLERRKLASALETAQGQLAALCAQFQTNSKSEKGAIFAAHRELASDPELLDLAESAIAKSKSAAFAWNKAVATLADRLASLRNELLAQRANDLRDVGFRILALLTEESIQRQYYPSNSILVAEDFAPSDVADFDRSRVLAFCTTRGGATSHVAILARSLGIPMLAGIHPAALDVPDGTVAILNACKGTLQSRPSPQEIEYLRSNQEHTQRHRENDLLTARSPAVTLDGTHIEVLANICGLKDATVLNASGGDGVGLLRSEFIFMNSAVAPTEDQQFESYKTIVQLIGPDRSIIIRTLDTGGDKPLSYLPIPKEDNPFLGERGVRVCLGHPDILRCQLRAILRAASFGKVSVMFPMITTLSELREVKMMLAQEAAALGVPNIPAGIMVEVPAAAVMAAHFAKESAFFSIGTNDLTQYTLAMDRGHTKLAAQVDSLNPAVLRLIAHTVTGARTKNRPVGICGGIASDPHAVPILLGLGVNELSVSLPSIPTIKAQIRTLRIDSCRELAERALAAESPEEVRALGPDFGFAPFPNPTE